VGAPSILLAIFQILYINPESIRLAKEFDSSCIVNNHLLTEICGDLLKKPHGFVSAGNG